MSDWQALKSQLTTFLPAEQSCVFFRGSQVSHISLKFPRINYHIVFLKNFFCGLCGNWRKLLKLPGVFKHWIKVQGMGTRSVSYL